MLDIGYINPLTGEGVNHPYINKKHYVFENIIIDIKPNLEDSTTNTVFEDIQFAQNSIISIKPTSSLNDIGKLC